MKSILISGGAGYLGTVLTQYLLNKGYQVVVYDQLYFPWLYRNRKSLKNFQNLKFIKKNIIDVNINDFKKIDIVCDLNGIPNDPASEINKKYTWKINSDGRKKFAKLAKKAGVKRYIFNSTCSVYGFNNNIVNERSRVNPLSTYAKANLSSEKYIYSIKSKKFRVNVLRNSTLFGFSNNLRLDLVINIFVYNILRNKKIIIDGDGEQFRPFISLLDICRIYNFILTRNLPSFKVNLVHFNMTIRQLTIKICKILNVKFVKVVKFNNKFFDKRNYNVQSVCFNRIFKNFKFSPFKQEIVLIKRGILKNKIRTNSSNIRMKFYKRLF